MNAGHRSLGTWIGSAAIGVAFLACSSSNGGGSDASSDASSGASSDAPSGTSDSPGDGAPQTLGTCHWPDSLNDAGSGACTVGRTYLNCRFPSGVGCGAVSSPGPLTEGCISSDLTGCPGCDPAVGATCEDQCGPDEYAVSCGGPPHFADDGSFTYQQAPAGCRDVGSTPGGNTYSCCPCG